MYRQREEKKKRKEYRAAGNAVHLRLVWAVVAVAVVVFPILLSSNG